VARGGGAPQENRAGEEQAGKLEANLEELRALTETGFAQSRYRVADIV
jgi:hypothetical protein